MSQIHGPIVPRKRLGATLKRLREAANLTLDQVASDLLISTSKLSRLENAQGSPQARDVRDLAVYYKVANTSLGDQLMRWSRDGRRQAWWANYQDVLDRDPSFDAYLAYETETSIARVYTLPYVSGLLQTADYTRSLIGAMDPWRTPEEIERFVQVRKLRQQILTHREGRAPLELTTIIHESCLTQFVGSFKIMRDQLEALLKVATLPNVEIRILPASSEAHTMNTCTWSYFIFSEDTFDRDVVQIENHAGFFQIERPEQVKRYDRAFEELTRRSLGSEDSCEFIQSVLARQEAEMQ
ncbi:MAG: helix-turn-helix domain-containing protein [Gammaproteobacteria bacterium]